MDADTKDLLGLFHTLQTPLSGIQAYTILILNYDKFRRNVPRECIDWVETNSKTFEIWNNNLGNLRTSDKRELTAEQLSQQIIGSFEGFESVMEEANNLSKKFALKGKRDDLVGGIIDGLSGICEHYNHLHENPQN